jgi:hypothetical protein
VQATPAVVLLSCTLATSLACGSGTFTIKHEKFQATDICDGTGTLRVFMKGDTVQAQAQTPLQTHMLKGGLPSIWCHGLTHQYAGTVRVHGYTFESDASDPLQFRVDRKKGYHYVSGKGAVTAPDGKVTTLP